ncbi:TonB-dependent receptor [bacterium]|nr:TonB-dependent receptor [bacterium]
MKTNRMLICTIVLLFTAAWIAPAQDTRDLMSMDLEDILNLQMTVFSVQGLTQRETPGVVTLISEEEIARSGARDLIDILRLVPGFDIGVDIQSAMSLGIRGIWAQEGKVLLMVDNMEMNEILYSCLALGGHIPVDMIRQIEIIRGPGTSFYGSNAELAVVNILTKNASALNGIETVLRGGRSVEGANHYSLSANFGKKRKDLRTKILMHFGQSVRSDRDYTDIYGTTVNMLDHADIRPVFCLAGIEYRGLKSDVLFDRYLYGQQDGLDVILDNPVNVSFNTLTVHTRYESPLGSRFTLTPGFMYLRQEPWKSADQTALENDFFYHEIAERFRGSLVLKGSPAVNFQLVAGADFIRDRARVSGDTPEDQFFSDGRSHIGNSRFCTYAQVFYTKGRTIPSVGIRYDRHNVCGDDILPWVGISQSAGPWTFKGLFGQTFRAPALENLDINPELEPEKTTTAEIEIGYQLKNNWICLLDIFNTMVRGPIVYYYDPESEEELYGNFGNLESSGIEIESRLRWKAGSLNLGYSYCRSDETIESYSVNGQNGLFLGFPAHKFALNGCVTLKPHLYLAPSAILTTKKFGYATLNLDDEYVTQSYGPALLVNVYLSHDRLFGRFLEGGIGIYNLTNDKNPAIQPYDSGHAPMSVLSREILVHLKYHWKW